MGCHYYIYTVLKIVHPNGIDLIKLSEEPVYLYGYNDDDDDMFIHPSNRRPKIDHMEPVNKDVKIYTKGEENSDIYINKYIELVEEYIKDCEDENYNTKNKVILNNFMFQHQSTGQYIKDINDITEMYIVELRAWRN